MIWTGFVATWPWLLAVIKLIMKGSSAVKQSVKCEVICLTDEACTNMAHEKQE